MEQEQINIEDIMQEIRAEIRAKGYADNEIPFSDIACLVGGTEVPFDLKDYLDDISMMDESRTVLAYRDISSTRIEYLEMKIYKCERRIRELEEELKKNQA